MLSIRAGKATVERASGADAAHSLGALAPLFSGLLSAFELQKLGLLRADIGAVATLHDFFRAPVPWVGEMF